MSQRASHKISRTIGFLVAITSLLPLSSVQADLAWSTFFTDEDAISSATTLTTPDNGLSFTTAVNEDNTGDFSAFSSSNLFTYEGDGSSGGQTQYLEISFDQNSDAPDDFLELRMDFASAVQNLSFSVMDIDVGPDTGFLLQLTASPSFRIWSKCL